jgi:YD repeat-containing protein
VSWSDRNGQARILAATPPNGAAQVSWFDKNGKGRILAATLPDGKVTYPTMDGK